MTLASYRSALIAVEAGLDLETAVMAVLMLAPEDDGAALAGFYPLTADEIAERIMVEGGRLPSDPPESESGA